MAEILIDPEEERRLANVAKLYTDGKPYNMTDEGGGDYGWGQCLTREGAVQILYNLLEKLDLLDWLKEEECYDRMDSHTRIWRHNEGADLILSDHETRIKSIEKTGMPGREVT